MIKDTLSLLAILPPTIKESLTPDVEMHPKHYAKNYSSRT
jgi:hypothetical protein